MNSSKITLELTTYNINKKTLLHDIREDNLKKLKTEIKKSTEENCKNVIERIITKMNDTLRPK